MTDRELMQQALDLLDDINQCSLPPTGIPLPAEIDHVMEALRARLAQPDLITPTDVEQLARIEKLVDKIDPYEAQPEQEPVAWMHPTSRDCVSTQSHSYKDAIPLYTAPPQREWQGLTDEERRKLWNAPKNLERPMDFSRAIEAKLKEKNA